MKLESKILWLAASGIVAVWWLKRLFAGRSNPAGAGYDKQFTGAFPRYSGAISAVTGGPPEDINAMPTVPAVSASKWSDTAEFPARSRESLG